MAEDVVAAVWLHRDAHDEAERHEVSPAGLAATLCDAWRRLRTTSGSTLRRLSNTPGREFRLRMRKIRAVFTTVHSADGSLAAFVHLIASRGAVYESDAFFARVQHFHATVLDAAKASRAPGVVAQYASVFGDVSAIEVADIDYDLFGPQQQFFNSVLPFGGISRVSEPQLVIGLGPPGSGKTIVGQQLVREARALGYDVDVLVPSVKLVRMYQEYAESVHTPTDEAPAALRIFRFDEYFAKTAGESLSAERESAVRKWWAHFCATPRIQARLSRHSISEHGSEQKLATLADTLLEDGDWIESRTGVGDGHQRDFLADDYWRLEKILRELRDAGAAASLAGANDLKEAVVTRAALANRAWDNASRRTGQRLILVDEAQDLAPCEWRTLLKLAFDASRQGADPDSDWRVVLLGDMRQRVSLVPFDWGTVTRYVASDKLLPQHRVVKLDVDRVSYRMHREVGRAAQSVFHRDLLGGAYRQHSQFDPEALAPGGRITAVVTARSWRSIAECMATVPVDPDRGEQLVVVHQESERRAVFTGIKTVLADSVRGAKGLEFERVIMLCRSDWQPPRKGEPLLSGEDATELFTAISRAKMRVMLIAPRPLWDVLSRVAPWNTRSTCICMEPDDRELRQLFEEHRSQLTSDALMEALQGTIFALCSESGTEDDWLQIMADRLERVSKVPDQDPEEAARDLVDHGVQLLQVSKSRYEELRDAVGTRRQEWSPAVTCGALVLLGELALAIHWARVYAADSRMGCWNAASLEKLAAESPVQRSISGEWNPTERFIWTEQRYEADLRLAFERHLSDLAVRRPTRTSLD